PPRAGRLGGRPPRPDPHLPPAARGVVPRLRRPRGGDPGHRPSRARPLLRARRGPPRRPRVFLRNVEAMWRVVRDMNTTTLSGIHAEIERLSEERSEAWHRLSAVYDSELKEEIRRLDAEIYSIWDGNRSLLA